MIQQINKHIYCKLDVEKENIAIRILNLQYEMQLKKTHNTCGYNSYRQRMTYCISQMAEAVNQNEVILFASYAAWAKIALGSMGIGAKELVMDLECSLIVFKQMFSDVQFQILKPFVEAALEQLKSETNEIPSYIKKQNPFSEMASKYLELVLKGKKRSATNLILDAAENGMSIRNIYLNIFECTQHEIGRLWQMGKVSVGQEHYCTALTQVIIAQLYPTIFKNRNEPKGYKYIGVCVSDELHEIGARMVADFLEQDGWDTYYLGANMPVKDILKAIVEIQPKVIGLSTTMVSNISKVENVINEIRKNFGNERVQIITGGYPFNLSANLWRNMGADGHSRDAAEAVALSNALVNGGAT